MTQLKHSFCEPFFEYKMNQYRFQKSKKGRKEDILETMEKADEAVSDANEEKLNVSSDDPDQLIIFQ